MYIFTTYLGLIHIYLIRDDLNKKGFHNTQNYAIIDKIKNISYKCKMKLKSYLYHYKSNETDKIEQILNNTINNNNNNSNIELMHRIDILLSTQQYLNTPVNTPIEGKILYGIRLISFKIWCRLYVHLVYVYTNLSCPNNCTFVCTCITKYVHTCI